MDNYIRKTLKFLCVLFLILKTSYLFPQLNSDSYVVFIFEKDWKKDSHKPKSYYWIIPEDSLKVNNANISPLYFEGYTREAYDNCCSNKLTYIFTPSGTVNFELGDRHEKLTKYLRILIGKNRRKVLTITNRWQNQRVKKEKIKVYFTPLIGTFCSCKMGEQAGEVIKYSGTIYLPLNFCSINHSFDYKNNKLKMIISRMFEVHLQNTVR